MVDTSPAGISAAFSNAMTGNIGSIIMKTLFWMVIIAAVGIVFTIIYMLITYKYKFIIFKGYGDGTGGRGVGKPKFDLGREKKDGSWQLLFRRKHNLEPFADNFIYPGNWVAAYEVDGKIVPGKILMEKKDMVIEPVPYSVRKKTELELQQLEQDFAKMDKWEANKIFIYTLIGAGMVIALAGFVLWLSFKKTDQLIPALSNFGDTIKNVGTIPGKG